MDANSSVLGGPSLPQGQPGPQGRPKVLGERGQACRAFSQLPPLDGACHTHTWVLRAGGAWGRASAPEGPSETACLLTRLSMCGSPRGHEGSRDSAGARQP